MSRSVRRSLLYRLVMAPGLLSIVRLLTRASVSFQDLSLYWYAGQLIWQGSNPYVAHLEQVQPALPISSKDSLAWPMLIGFLFGSLALALELLGADAFVLSARQRRWLYALALLLAVFWITPVTLLTGAWGYRMLANSATSVALLSSLGLLFRLRDTSATTRRLAPLWAAR